MKDPIKDPILIDPIVEEIHRMRAERAKQFPTLEALVKHLRQREALSRARGVKFSDPPKRRKPRGARKTTSGK
ncbi:MAG: hypothetical protein FWE88_00070 [Phycisphaerae bacterium]|nr:hypothetical protein [Phycisphaerae bacterium]